MFDEIQEKVNNVFVMKSLSLNERGEAPSIRILNSIWLIFFFSRKSKVKELLKNKYQEDKIYAGTDVNNHECFGEYLKILI